MILHVNLEVPLYVMSFNFLLILLSSESHDHFKKCPYRRIEGAPSTLATAS